MQFLDDFEDLDILTKGEFSTVATVSSATAPLITELSGIFDSNYQEAFGFHGDQQNAEGRKFCFQVQTTEIAGIVHGDRLVIYGKSYLIINIQPRHDGKLSYLILKQDLDNLPIVPADQLDESVLLFDLPAETWVNFPAASIAWENWQVLIEGQDRTEDFLYRDDSNSYQIRSSLPYQNVVFRYF